MGYAIDWVCVAGLEKDEVLRRLDLVDTGEEQDWPDRGGSIWGVDDDGRVIVVTDAYGSLAPNRLPMLSQGASVVGATAEDNDCTGSVWSYVDGACKWMVAVDSAEDPSDEITAEGDLPPQYAPLREQALARAEADPATAYTQEVPLELAAALGGWRPDGLGPEPVFYRAASLKPQREPARSGLVTLLWPMLGVLAIVVVILYLRR